MDVVTDLTSQAVSYVCIIQDICKEQPGVDRSNNKTAYLLDAVKSIGPIWEKCSSNQRQNISEITWISKNEIFLDESLDYFSETTISIIEWYLKFHKETEEYLESKSIGPLGLNSSPYQWRQGMRYILYRHPHERTTLVKILHYIPLQIILCLGGGALCAYDQRLFQVWEPDYKLNTTSEKDMADSSRWWINEYKGQKRVDHAIQLLEHDDDLLQQLIREDIPVPFESIFHDELDEIKAIREVRLHHDQDGKKSDFEKAVFGKNGNGHSDDHSEKNDPLERAKSMNLYGLTFSGGGIRSATFNLGILQKLADQNLLKKFDYLSTVSGGGYIGSWFASWVQRTGSISSVNDRLNPEKSADPLGEDVRPIRWLRMFSNYLSPNASIMSADAWTVGITWLRNTLINQVILLLLLCSALFGVQFIYHSWAYITSVYKSDVCWWKIVLWSIPIFIPSALFAGFGMRAYSQEPPHSPFSREKNSVLAYWLIGWGLASAFGVSSWFFTSQISTDHDEYVTIFSKTKELLPAAGVGFIALLIVAYIGQYGKYNANRLKAWAFIVSSSILAALAGALLLACGWQILNNIKTACAGSENRNQIGFMVALPLILEVISIIVVVRMAFLGSVFPDERREWWGRAGAIVHRFMFIWIVAVAAIFFLPNLGTLFTDKAFTSKVIAAFGGWAALIGAAVKMAFNPKTSGDKPSKGSLSAAELFIRVAPYIFALGFLVIGAYVSRHIFTAIPISSINPETHRLYELLLGLVLCIVVGGVTALISWRIGVNEFSLHHFYRNRLVRAYLGATRRRKEREQTVNNFTNFDKLDDLKLAGLVKAKGYCGPFMILNAALNATVVTDELDRQDRKAESFIFTSKYCGFDCSRTRSASRSAKKSYDYGYRPTAEYSKIDGPELGTAMAVSGAAVNPNMGYHSSSATAFLLTIFNVRLGLWIGNPRKSAWRQSDPKFGLAYLVDDLVGKSDTTADFVCLSDGGHFDNMGVYELVRRKCKFILVCDAEEDDDASCEGFANAIRRCRIDFGAQIEIDITPVVRDPVTKISKQHYVSGTIWYMGDPAGKPSGKLTYVKTSLTGNESVDVREYLIENPQFPEQSTADQFFDESQFESYRKLGYSSL